MGEGGGEVGGSELGREFNREGGGELAEEFNREGGGEAGGGCEGEG